MFPFLEGNLCKFVICTDHGKNDPLGSDNMVTAYTYSSDDILVIELHTVTIPSKIK